MIITFYSYKGGVGRSMALANVAELMAQQGLAVLAVDFDLEAPGLERFFDEPDALTAPADIQKHRGLIDLLTSYRDLWLLPSLEEPPAEPAGGFPHAAEPVPSFVVPIRAYQQSGGSLSLLPAGRRAGAEYAAYADKVRAFNWEDFYTSFDGEAFFEWFRREAEAVADVVLVDSRTGITEMSGVCTFQLADVVLLIAAPNRQNIDGCAKMGEGLSNPRLVTEGRHGRGLRLLPVPGRVERGESELLAWFAGEFDRRLGRFVPPELSFETSPFVDLQIPYIPRYAYTERIAVREPAQPAAADIIGAFRRLTGALVQLAPRDSALSRAFAARERSRPEPYPPLPADFVTRPAPLARVGAWLADPSAAPVLLLTGGPGSGKTTFLRWLLELGPGTVPTLDGVVVSAHLPGARPLNARRLVETLAVRLSEVFPAYREALLRILSADRDLGVDVRRTLSASGSRETAWVESLTLPADMPVGWAYATLVGRPMSRVDLGGARPLVLLDVRDEATPGEMQSVLTLLVDIATEPAASPVRFLVASRPDAHVVSALGALVVDLTAGESARGDVARYVRSRLATTAAEIVVERSEGNFLYARLVVDAILQAGEGGPDPAVPDGLAAFYGRLARQALAERRDRQELDAEILGILTVAQASLDRRQLAGITGQRPSAIEDFVRGWADLIVEEAGGGIAFFHASLGEWFRSTPLIPVSQAEAHRGIGRHFAAEYLGSWDTCDDMYAIRYTVRHLLAAAAGARRSAWASLARDLEGVLGDPTYLAVKQRRAGRRELFADLRDAALVFMPGRLAEELQAAEALDGPPPGDRGPAEDLPALLGEALTGFFAATYERIRATQPPGGDRTARLDAMVGALNDLSTYVSWLPIRANDLLAGGEGERVAGLAVAQARPETARFALVLDTIRASRSAFEQFHGLVAARAMMPVLTPAQRQDLAAAIRAELEDRRGLGLTADTNRAVLAAELLLDIDARTAGPDLPGAG